MTMTMMLSLSSSSSNQNVSLLSLQISKLLLEARYATGKIDRNVILHPEYSAIVAPISNPGLSRSKHRSYYTLTYGKASFWELFSNNTERNREHRHAYALHASCDDKAMRSVVSPPGHPMAYPPITIVFSFFHRSLPDYS